MIARKLAILAAVYLGCTTAPELSVCSNGRVCPAETVCVDALDSCIGDDEFTSCRNRDGEVCQKEGDLGICQDGACSMSCGDELVQLGQGEECESAEGLDCGAFGFYEGTVSCTSCAVDTSTCSGFCGDGLINGAELCEPTTLTESCSSFGYDLGATGCETCLPNLERCRTLGWRQFDADFQVLHLGSTPGGILYAIGRLAPTPLQREIFLWDGLGWRRDPAIVAAVGSIASVYFWSETDAIIKSLDDDEYFVLEDGVITPIAAPSIGTTYTLWASGPSDIYVGGYDSLVHFDGSEWTTVEGIDRVIQIDGRSSSDVWLIRDVTFSKIAIEHFDGAQWTRVAEGSIDASAQDLAVTDAEVYAIFGGKLWRLVPNPELAIDQQLVAIYDEPGDGANVVAGRGDVAFVGASDNVLRCVADSCAALGFVPTGPSGIRKLAVLSPWRVAINTPNTDQDMLIWDGTHRLGTGGQYDGRRLSAGSRVTAHRSGGLVREDDGSGAFGALVCVSTGCDGVGGLRDAWPYQADQYALLNDLGDIFIGDPSGFVQQTLPSGADWQELAVAGDLIFARGPVTDGVTPLAVFNQGSWTVQDIPAAINDIDATSALAVAVGDGGAIYEWTGGDWLAASSGATANLLAVTVFGDGALVVGAGGAFSSRVSGSWAAISTDQPLDFVDVGASSTGDALLVASDGDTWQWDGNQISRLDLEGVLDVELQNGIVSFLQQVTTSPSVITFRRYAPWGDCEASESSCNDLTDNDCDGLIDLEDSADCPAP